MLNHRTWHRRLVAPFKGDGEAVQRVSAAALLGTLVPVGLAGSWLAHPHTPPTPALLVSAAVLVVLAGRCLMRRPIPGWVWAIHVLAVPVWWYALQLDVARPPDAYMVLMLVLPVGWVGSWLSLRMTVLSIALESAALAAATLRGAAGGATVLETAAGIVVLTVVGLMGYSQLVALREARTAAEADAYTDPLTGARSRRYGLVRLEAELGAEPDAPARAARTRDARHRLVQAGLRRERASRRRRSPAGARPARALVAARGRRAGPVGRRGVPDPAPEHGRPGHRDGDRRTCPRRRARNGRSRRPRA